MNFWSWLNDENYEYERFGDGKRTIIAVVVFILVPWLIYHFVIHDPTLSRDWEEGISIGMYVIAGLYWLGAYFSYKRYETTERLNKLIDKLLDEEEAERLFETARRKREIFKKDKLSFEVSERGEDRTRWFGIWN